MTFLAATWADVVAVELLALAVLLLVAGWASGGRLSDMLGLTDPPPGEEEPEWEPPA